MRSIWHLKRSSAWVGGTFVRLLLSRRSWEGLRAASAGRHKAVGAGRTLSVGGGGMVCEKDVAVGPHCQMGGGGKLGRG